VPLIWIGKCPDGSDLMNVQLPHLIVLGSVASTRGAWGEAFPNRDGKLVDFNDMVIVIVKCFDYNWMNGSESD